MEQADYKSLLYHSPFAYAYLEAVYDSKGEIKDFRFIELNSRFKEMSAKLRGKDIRGRTVSEVLPDYVNSAIEFKKYEKVALEGGSFSREYFLEPSGNWYYVLIYSSKKGFLATFIQDITEQKVAVEKMKTSEIKFRSLFENLVEGVYRTTMEGRIIDANPALVELLGFPDMESLLKTNVNELYYEQQDRNKELHLLAKNNVILSNEIRLKRYDGKLIWVSDSFRVIRDNDDNPVCLEGTIIDVTERKEAEEALQKSEERYKNFISQVTDAVYRFELTEPIAIDIPVDEQIDLIYDRSRLEEFNPAFLKMYNIENGSDIKGKSILEFHGTRDNPQNRKVTGDFIRAGYKTENNITEEVDSQGNIKFINNNTIGIVKDGYLIRTWGTQTDITERINFEKELLLAKKKAEESNRLKTHFLANMSHEIRTPMNSIIGFMEILQSLDLSKEEREIYMNTMHESGQRLLDTINDIIEMSKIETGNIKPRVSETDISGIMKNIFELFRPRTDEKGLKLVLNNNKDKDYNMLTDSNLLTAILSSLLKNAVKFTNTGRIEFGNSLEDDSVMFYVKDTGIGIPREQQESIFDRFVQADPGLSRTHEGSGLGLSIARAYANLLGGRIWLKSNEREGSTFYLSLPHKPPVNE